MAVQPCMEWISVLKKEYLRLIGLYTWVHLTEGLKAESSFQTSRKPVNDWLEPKSISSLKVGKNDE